MCVHLYRYKCGNVDCTSVSIFSGKGSNTRAIVLAVTFVCDHKYDFTIATWNFWLYQKQRAGIEPGTSKPCMCLFMLNIIVKTKTDNNLKKKEMLWTYTSMYRLSLLFFWNFQQNSCEIWYDNGELRTNRSRKIKTLHKVLMIML